VQCGGELAAASPCGRLSAADGRVWLLTDRISIGRDPENDVTVVDSLASRKHCTIERRAGGFVIRDLGSRNGTFVNGRAVAGAVPLRDRDLIRIGGTALRFEVGEGREAGDDRSLEPSVTGRGFGDEPRGRGTLLRSESVPPFGRAPGPPADSAPDEPLRVLEEPPAPAAEARPSPVQVSSVLPESVAPGTEFVVELLLHLPNYDVEAGPGWVADVNLALVHLFPGAIVDFRVCLDERQERYFALDVGEARVSWQPPCSRASFRFRVAEHAPHGPSYVRVEVGAGGICLCHFHLDLRVDPNATVPSRRRHSVARKLPRSAFASYATVDRAAVCERLESVQALGIDVFLDCLDIRQGARWQEELHQAAISKDVFLLFWSSAAARSRWVTLEWTSALDARGLDYIVPNALESVQTCPPPERLASLQFGSRFALAKDEAR
jgi:hypothetical protein